ncbi:hypothetical protein MTO96_034749 [Rhipicephalus appendiculatus]
MPSVLLSVMEADDNGCSNSGSDDIRSDDCSAAQKGYPKSLILLQAQSGHIPRRRYAVNEASIREVGILFDMADSAQLLVIDRVLDFLSDIAKDVVEFPKDKEAIAKEFEKRVVLCN